MTSWDDLDIFKLNLQPHFQGASRPNTPWQGGFQHVHQTSTPSMQSTLSLDRYLQLLQLLCHHGGQPLGETGAAANTWTVRQLGELERSAVKMEDLKKVLALNGRVISAKNKQDMLDKVAGIQLSSPIFFASNPAIRNQSLREDDQKQELEQGMQRALQWADLSPSESIVATAAISRQGCYSFCSLPEIKLPSSSTQAPPVPATEAEALEREEFQQQQQQQGLFFMPTEQRAATSATTTLVSRPEIPHAHIAESSSPPPIHPIAPTDGYGISGRGAAVIEGDTEMHDAMQTNQFRQHQFQHPTPLNSNFFRSSTPNWLITGYQNLSKICRGTGIGISTAPGDKDVIKLNNSTNLVGRKVALVLIDDFNQDGDIISRGIHLGQVVEWTGDLHDGDACPADCRQHHNFCYVRVTPTETTAPAHRRSRRRLDLAVDLREEYRLESLEDLLLVGEKELADAWVLVEPKDYEEGT